MSRYIVPQENPTQEVVIGWDNPLTSFFAQVFDLTADDDENDCVYWIGADYNALPTVEALQATLGNIATIPEALCDALRADQRNAEPPTPLQQSMRASYERKNLRRTH